VQIRNSQNSKVCSGDKSKMDVTGGAIGTHNITTDLQHYGREVNRIYIAVRLELVAGSCEHGNELPSSLQRREFLALQSTLLKKVSPPSSWWARTHLSSTAWKISQFLESCLDM
jgi:hypothetical protein